MQTGTRHRRSRLLARGMQSVLIPHPMKLLWITLLPGDVEVAATGVRVAGHSVPWITSHLPPPEDVELHVACLWPGGQEKRRIEYRGAHFHLIPCPARGRALTLFAQDPALFRPVMEVVRPDVVHGWGTEDSCALVAQRLSPSKHVVGVQGLIAAYRKRVRMPRRTLLTQITERRALARARWVVAECRYALAEARHLCPKANAKVIEHPLRQQFLGDRFADGRSNRVLFLGTLDARKGFLDAVAAFAKGAPTDWKLDMVGRGAPEAESLLLQSVEKLGLAGRFTLHRHLEEGPLAELMQQSAVFLLPTRIDTGPTALKEALAMGLWPICYDNSGPADYIREFSFGSLARDLDEQDLARCVADNLRERPWLDPVSRNRLFNATRERFSPANIWRQLTDLYASVIAGE